MKSQYSGRVAEPAKRIQRARLWDFQAKRLGWIRPEAVRAPEPTGIPDRALSWAAGLESQERDDVGLRLLANVMAHLAASELPSVP